MGHDGNSSEERGFLRSRANLVLIGFLAIGGIFLVSEHRAHLLPYLGYWPLLLILACPLLHFFMHGGHGNHGRDDGNADSGSADNRRITPPHQH